MGRLIDADKFISWLDCGHLRNPSEKCLSELNVKQMIDNQPTAYDVDKVVAQLESFKCSKEEAEKDMDIFIRNHHFDMCISIVKAGGWNKEKETIE